MHFYFSAVSTQNKINKSANLAEATVAIVKTDLESVLQCQTISDTKQYRKTILELTWYMEHSSQTSMY